MFIAAVLMAVPRLPIGWLNARFVPATAAIHALGVIFVAAGLGFAVWARLHLGRNWSGEITLKLEHELIRSGPYALVRHPIYSGMLVAMLGTAIVIGQWRALVALVFFVAAVLRRARVEECWMGEIFSDAYARYRREVPALIPFPHYWRYRGEPHEQ
jgi:protein-S-isoprenylcysteine O-methyltransferase Ste14